ncbi:hypothetical protein P3437_02400 [Vibrio parahaemolyticus]|nr:hypothetical protein [Vibrio alginolyticus]MDF4453526.1 hypothetical protein [Vibrio parahaemolyticus]
MILEFETVSALNWKYSPTLLQYLSKENPYHYWISITLALLLLRLLILYFTYKHNDDWKPYESSSAFKQFLNLIFLFSSIFWAAAVSVFGTNLYKQWTGVDKLSYESLIFVVSASIALYLGVRSFLSSEKKEIHEKIAPSSKVVMLASDSIIDVQDNYEQCYEDWISTYSEKFVKEGNLKVLEETIANNLTFCMDRMIDILHTWTSDSGTVIKVNLLNILDAKSLLKELQQDPNGGLVTPSILEQSPFFLFKNNWQSCLERCDKVLINEQKLTRVIGACETPRAHAPLCLPYSINDKTEQGAQMQPNLIGAPDALRTGSIKYITPLQDRIEDFIRTKIKGSCYSEHTTKFYERGLRKYYDSDTAASIISIPLVYIQPKVLFKDSEESEKAPVDEIESDIEEPEQRVFVSVLNIYAHSNYILANNDVVQSYCQLTKPIWDTLAKLVSMKLQVLSDINATNKKQ